MSFSSFFVTNIFPVKVNLMEIIIYKEKNLWTLRYFYFNHKLSKFNNINRSSIDEKILIKDNRKLLYNQLEQSPFNVYDGK